MPQYLRVKEVASFLRIQKGALDRWRLKGQGPPWFKIGKIVYYDRDELLAWIERRKAAAQQLSRGL